MVQLPTPPPATKITKVVCYFIPLLAISGSESSGFTTLWILGTGVVVVGSVLLFFFPPAAVAGLGGAIVSGFTAGGAAAAPAVTAVATVPAATAVVVAAPGVAAALPAAAAVAVAVIPAALPAASALATATGSSVISGSILPPISSVVVSTVAGVAITLATGATAPAWPTLTVNLEQIELENPRLPEEIEYSPEEVARLPEELEQFVEMPVAVQFPHLPSYTQNLWDNFHNYHPRLNSWELAHYYDTWSNVQTVPNISAHLDFFQQYILRGYVRTLADSRAAHYNPTRSIEMLWSDDYTQRSMDLLWRYFHRQYQTSCNRERIDAAMESGQILLHEPNYAAIQEEILNTLLYSGLYAAGFLSCIYSLNIMWEDYRKQK